MFIRGGVVLFDLIASWMTMEVIVVVWWE